MKDYFIWLVIAGAVFFALELLVMTIYEKMGWPHAPAIGIGPPPVFGSIAIFCFIGAGICVALTALKVIWVAM